jgi:hypothetical protein
LYILAGLPVIVPSSGAAALIVKKYGIGIIVDSLYGIENEIRRVSEKDYQAMLDAMRPLANRISEGRCLGNALSLLVD